MPFRSPTYDEVEYYTGLSREEIDKIADKCQEKLYIKNGYAEGCLIGRICGLCDLVKEGKLDCETISAMPCFDEQNPKRRYLFTLWRNNAGYRFALTEDKVKPFGEFLIGCCEYMLKHGTGM